MKQELAIAIKDIKKEIRYLQKFPHKSKKRSIRIRKLKRTLVTFENACFSQNITRFRSKNQQFTKLEEYNLGKVRALDLRTQVTARDKLPQTPLKRIGQ